MRKIAPALVLVAAVITAASARQRNNSAAFDGLREFIKQQLAERRLPSIAVAVARDGQIIWEEAFERAHGLGRIEEGMTRIETSIRTAKCADRAPR